MVSSVSLSMGWFRTLNLDISIYSSYSWDIDGLPLDGNIITNQRLGHKKKEKKKKLLQQCNHKKNATKVPSKNQSTNLHFSFFLQIGYMEASAANKIADPPSIDSKLSSAFSLLCPDSYARAHPSQCIQ